MTTEISWPIIERQKSRHDFQLETHISLRHDYIYLQLCKCGSSTLRYHLQKIEFSSTPYSVVDVNNKHVSPHLWPFQLKDDALFELLRSPMIRKVAFVRNPFTRLLSAYLQRVALPSPSRRRLLATVKKPEGYDISFAEFVEFVGAQQNPNEMDSHWRPQIDGLCSPAISLSFVGRVETLPADLQALSLHLFGESRFDSAEIDKIHLAPVRTDARERISAFYTTRLAALVRDRYAMDFSAFAYSLDLPS